MTSLTERKRKWPDSEDQENVHPMRGTRPSKRAKSQEEKEQTVENNSSRTQESRRVTRSRAGEQVEQNLEENCSSQPQGTTMSTRLRPAEVEVAVKRSNLPLSCCNEPERLQYHVPNDHCTHDLGCRIPPGDTCYIYHYGGKKKKLCKDHYIEDPMPMHQKDRWFEKRINENRSFEPIVKCSNCGEKCHKICVLHVEKSKWLCKGCGNGSRMVTVNRRNRTEPKSSEYMMKKLNGFLKDSSISIKTFTSPGTSQIDNVIAKTLQEGFQGPLHYQKRAIYVYQKHTDGNDVVFFAMYCREYRNTDIYNKENGGNWFVVDYLDSVPYFDGPQRKELYHRIILAYFDFMKSIGIRNGFLHADPPIQGDDYAFNIHPKTQVYKWENELIKWYRAIFKAGKREGIIESFRNFKEENTLREFKSPMEIPLFEGTLWSKYAVGLKDFENSMEEKFKEHKNDNFFITLGQVDSEEEKDDEWMNENLVMVDRVKFLDLCQRRNWEFGTLRHARYSTAAIDKWLEEQEAQKK